MTADEAAANPKPREDKSKGHSEALTDSLGPDIVPGRAGEGAMVGLYKLLQLIGQGGMGEVWLAEQKEPVRAVWLSSLSSPAWIRAR